MGFGKACQPDDPMDPVLLFLLMFLSADSTEYMVRTEAVDGGGLRHWYILANLANFETGKEQIEAV